eukprot:12216131-Alexandrium_andersonii.AAC.1
MRSGTRCCSARWRRSVFCGRSAMSALQAILAAFAPLDITPAENTPSRRFSCEAPESRAVAGAQACRRRGPGERTWPENFYW